MLNKLFEKLFKIVRINDQNWDFCKLLKDDILKVHLQVDSVQLQKWRSSSMTHVSQSTSQHHLNWKDCLILLKIFFALSGITLQLQFSFTVAEWLVYPRPQQKPLQLFCPVANLQCVLGKPSREKSAVFLNIVQKAFAPPPLSFEHLSYFAGGVF